jgi:hypothetical protein
VGLLADRRTPASVRLLPAHETERVPRTGAVASAQEAEVSVPGVLLERIWSLEYLERLARAYWRHVRRMTLGLVRVVDREDSPAVVLLGRRLALLRFSAPEYELAPERGSVTWRIERGLLVAAEGRDRGCLSIGVERRPGPEPPRAEPRLRVRLEVRNFYPWLRGSGRFAWVGSWLYAQTQLRIHVFVCTTFLRSLARLDPPPSADGDQRRFARAGRGRSR